MTARVLAACKTAFPEAPIEATERSLKKKERRDSTPSFAQSSLSLRFDRNHY